MKIQFKNTPEQIELVKAMGSKDNKVSREATVIFAAFIAPVIQQVINVAGTSSKIYTDVPYNEDDSPSIPLDLYYNEDVGYVSTWSQSIAGGLPSSQVEGVKEMKVSTYRLDSAVHMLKKYARRSRLDVVAKTVEKMAQEILVKQERNAWAVILKALAEASTQSQQHVVQSATDDVFIVADLSELMTRIRRINAAFNGGSSATAPGEGLTDLYVSPEIKEQIRNFAFNPMNTRVGPTVPGSTLTSYTATTAIALPDAIREEIFRSAGSSEIYGVNITELLELGTSRRYNLLFSEFAGSTSYDGATFSGSGDEILVGFDLSRECFLRPIAQNADSGATFTTQVDDQWVARSEKLGWYGSLEESRIAVDSRGVAGIIV